MSDKPADLWALSDLCTPWCIHVAATLRIADHIDKSSSDIKQLATQAACDPIALKAVLRHLVGKGVFVEPSPGEFELNEAAKGLLDPGVLLGLDLEGIGGRMAYAWGTMLSYVRTGKSAYHEVFGLPIWEDLDAHPEVAASFDELIGPAGYGTPDPEILLDGDWSNVRTVVDVGGGTGALLTETLRSHPDVRGILVDLPRTVARSDEIFQCAGVSDRVSTMGQSFFEPLPPGANVYIPKSVLNDWPDDDAKVILSRCAEAARPAGRVVIIGGVSPDSDRGGLVIGWSCKAAERGPSLSSRRFPEKSGLSIALQDTRSRGDSS
jgi:hypothetical protein